MSLIHQMLSNMQDRRGSNANVLNYLRATGMDIPKEEAHPDQQRVKSHFFQKDDRPNPKRTLGIAVGGGVILLMAHFLLPPEKPAAPPVQVDVVAPPPPVVVKKVEQPPMPPPPPPPPPEVVAPPVKKEVVVPLLPPLPVKEVQAVRPPPPPPPPPPVEKKVVKPPPRLESPASIQENALQAMGKNNPALAEKILARGLQLYPRSADLLLLRARLALQAGDVDKAGGILAKVEGGGENRLELLGYQATLYRKNGQFQQGAEAYRLLIREEPDKGAWWLGLAICLDSLQQSNGARDAYQRAL
ncbi:MAG: tetratricopeptide repeat protein, partial [Magnetococcales bacterium]|nr:tetratricopeptide repeat protein [Magnetococcales bacterium]